MTANQDRIRYNKTRHMPLCGGWTRQHNRRERVPGGGKRIRDTIPLTPTITPPPSAEFLDLWGEGPFSLYKNTLTWGTRRDDMDMGGMETKMRETIFQRDFGNSPFNPWHKKRGYGYEGGAKWEETLEVTHLDSNHTSIIWQMFLDRVCKQLEGLILLL